MSNEQLIKEISKLAGIIPSDNQIQEITKILSTKDDIIRKTANISDYLMTFTPQTYVELYHLLNGS